MNGIPNAEPRRAGFMSVPARWARSVVMALIFTAAQMAPVTGLELQNLSDEERAAFDELVRQYIIANPQVIIDSLQAHEQQFAASIEDMDSELIHDHADTIFNSQNSWSGGNPEGDVTIVEFIDYRCQFCRNMFDIVNDVIAEDGNVRFVIKEFPILSEESEIMARLAIAVRHIGGDDAYKEIHDVMMTVTNLDNAYMEELAMRLSSNIEELTMFLFSDDAAAPIEESYFLADQLNIDGTPAFIIGSSIYRGAMTADELRDAIELARSENRQN